MPSTESSPVPHQIKARKTKKTGRKKTVNKGGRPTKLNQAMWDKLEQAFSMGCSDMEACLYADISHQTLYEWQAKYPELETRKKLLKHSPTLKARSIVIRDLKNDRSDTARWFLERKEKAEFSLRTEQTGANGGPIATASIPVDVDTPEAAAKAYAELIKGSE